MMFMIMAWCLGCQSSTEVENPRWWWGEPIWVTAVKQGQRSASYFFVGTGTEIEDTRPTYWRTYNGRVPPEMRVDKALAWFDKPVNERPTMISLYFSDTDDVGHEFGPDAEETKYAAWNADRYIARLMDGLKKRGIDQKVNIIIVSDHGMANVDPRNVTFLDDSFDVKLADKIVWNSEHVQIFPKSGMTDEIYNKIKDLPHVTCWTQDNIPARLHYNEGTADRPDRLFERARLDDRRPCMVRQVVQGSRRKRPSSRCPRLRQQISGDAGDVHCPRPGVQKRLRCRSVLKCRGL